MIKTATVSVLVVATMLVVVPGSVFADQSGWLVQFGTDKQEVAFGVAVHGHDVYVAGNTQGALGGPNSGAQDVYVRKYDTNGEVQWTRQFGTPQPDQTAIGAFDARGNRVVVGGQTTGTLGGMAFGKEDGFLRAYDKDGEVVWTLQFGSPETERVRHVVIAEDDSILVAGQTQGQLTDQLPFGMTDAFVMRLDRDGTVRWLRQFGTAGIDEAIGVAVTSDAVYVTGVTQGTFPGQVNAGDYDSFVARFTLDGEVEWLTQFGTSGSDGAWKIGAAGATLFVSGNTTGQFPGETAAGGNDAFVGAFGLDGALKWVRQFGTPGNENATGLAVDDEGAVTAGRCCGPQGLETTDPLADAFARKYDADGNVLWAIQFGTPAFDNAQDVAVKGRDVYIVGNTRGSFPGYVNAGLGDAWLMRLRTDGSDQHDDDTDED